MTVRDDEVPTARCPACQSVVPAARFCGECGARLDAPVTMGSRLLRPSVYATAHRETIWLPRVSSTLFPRFPGAIRKPFRIGLIVVLVGLIMFSLTRITGPAGIFTTIGWPLLFLIYVWQSDAFRDIPVRIMAIAAALGIASGVGWWLAAGKVLADSYGVTTASSLALTKVVSTGFLITLGGTALMLLPAVVTRLFPLPVRESLDGFVIGAFGALWYQTAATATTLAPQFAEGLMLEQSATRILADSLTYGVVTPLATTAAGGLVGLSLWFRPDRRPGRNPGRARAALTICTVVAVGLYVTVWAVDSLSLSRIVDVSLKLVVAVLAVLTARSAVQIALLHEAPDPATGAPVLCVHCEAVVPDLPFCCACGAAARASSRSSRRFRRENPPARELSPT